MDSKFSQKFNFKTFFLIFIISIFLVFLIYFRFVPIQNLRNAFNHNKSLITEIKTEQKGKKDLLEQISVYRDGLYSLNLVLDARKKIARGSDSENPYLVFDLKQVLNELRELLPDDSRATKFQINDKGLITMPIESVDYASLGRVLKSFKDNSQFSNTINSLDSKKAFREVKIPSGFQRSIEPSTLAKNKLVKNIYSFVLQAQLNPEYWQKRFSYSDIDPAAYYAQAVQELTLKRGIEGYSDGTFKPLQAITQAEFFKVVLFQFLSRGLISSQDYQHYINPPDKEWPHDYIQMANRMGIMQAGELEHTRPEESIPRIEALAIVLTIFNIKVESFDSNHDFTALPFVDLLQNSKSIPLIFTAYRKGILDYMKQEFKPEEPVSRAEIAYWIWKLQSD